MELKIFLDPKYFSCNSLKRATINLTRNTNGYIICYINDTGEQIPITKGRKYYLAIVVLLNYGFIL